MGDGSDLCELFADDCEFRYSSDADDLFSILETWEECINGGAGGGGGAAAAAAAFRPSAVVVGGAEASSVSARPTTSGRRREREGDEEKGRDGGSRGAPVRKKHKGSTSAAAVVAAAADDDGAAKMSHITVERNRRKQMNENLAVLRTLMPCFYVKRGDQASVIGGVVDYIKELQQVLHSLEAKKHRKVYAEQVLSPRPASTTASPRPASTTASPRPLIKSVPPLSPRLAMPISPRTPTPGSPYKPYPGGARLPPHPVAAPYISPAMTPTPTSSSHTQTHDLSPRPYLPTLDSIVTELAARAPAVAGGASLLLLLPDVKVEFAGPNLVLKTMSHRAPRQVIRIIAALESLSLEILHVSISNVDDTMVHSFTIKIGIECELSAEELVHEIRRTFL